MPDAESAPSAAAASASVSERTPLLPNSNDSTSSVFSTPKYAANGINSANGDATPPASNDDLEDATAGGNEEQVVVVQETRTRIFVVLGTVYVGVFVGAADGSVIATLSAPIASEFRSLSLLSWLAAAYLVANAACQPVSGRITDVVGRGPGLVFSNVFFALGNIICASAQSASTMLVGRVVAGIGGGGLMAIATFLASDLVPLRQRGVAQGIGNIAFGTGSMLGGVLGGATEHVWQDRWYGGWRLAFYAQVPVSVVSAILVFFLVRVPPHQPADDVGLGHSNSALSQLGRIDFPGAGLLVAFLVTLLLGLSAGGNVVPWTHPLVLASLPLALVAFAAFAVWEADYAHHPIIPVRLVVTRTVLAACIANLVCTAAMLTAVFYVPLYLQVRGYSAAEAGVRLLSSPLAVSFTSVGSGLVMKSTGRYVRLGVAALVIFVSGYALAVVGLSSIDSAPVFPFASLFFIGGGFGAMLTITLLACIASVAQSRQAVITSATYAFRSVGGTLGLTLASAVYQNILRKELWARFGHLPGAAEEIARIRDDLGELQHLPPGWHDGVIASFMDAFRGVWLMGLGLGGIGLVAMALMKQHTLHSTLSRP
ncbi:MFS multidrug transporter [Sporothrix schenckii 1099-18]|uniref:Major facilitator superfamily (MFS) profile domain-containing protein n=2 Tax=Sporothrix schenckii TaxID=29908 RepID=U7PUP2_SPOS1|nr:MFS multidrug transporter [Sporothrix schenckii 1099-18]ERS99322.1 hypothetical protein HMPREF1624_04521 [Sporothrix schenckii ATCC 58251]KJR82970.1 MFS multidrug transporter [Sporothrix schenckii 1099-18]